MATGYNHPTDGGEAELSQCQVYGLNHAAATSHTITIPANTRAMIMVMDTAVAYSCIIQAACLSANTVVASNISDGGTYISLDVSTNNKLKVSYTNSSSRIFDAVVVQYGNTSRMTM